MGATLAVHGLCKRFGSVVVADDVTFEVPAGSYCAVLGPSGSGKTSLFHMVAGLLQPDRGTIRLGEREFDAPGRHLPAERRRVGLVFQDYALWPHLRVGEQVAFGIPRGTAAGPAVARWLEMLRIAPLVRRYPHELSGGQKQRVAIARALAAEPDLLLLDEPFSNLDAPLRDALRDELAALCAALGISVIHVTHDRQEAAATADRVLVLAGGRLRQEGSPQDLYRNPADPLVAELLGPANLIPGTVDTVGDDEVVLVGSGVRLAGRNAGARLGAAGVAFFRPEAARLHAAADRPDRRNAFPARVERGGWHELGWRYRLRVAEGGPHIVVLSPVAVAAGAHVWVEVPPDACRVLPALEGGGGPSAERSPAPGRAAG